MEQQSITLGLSLSFLCPCFQVFEFDKKDSGLHRIKTAVHSDPFMKILGLTSMDPEDPNSFLPSRGHRVTTIPASPKAPRFFVG